MVRFDENSHTYTSQAGIDYTSVTTLIGKYKEPFDEDFWSSYKAIEKFIIKNNSRKFWEDYKSKVGIKNIVKQFNNKSTDSNKLLILQYKKEILLEWEYEKNVACNNGTDFHKRRESEWLASKSHIKDSIVFNTGIQTLQDNIPVPLESLSDGVYSELLLWNNYYEVAGQADIVYIETIDNTRYIDIDDYKTNKEIKETSFYNKKTRKYKCMTYPLNRIMDCNMKHYEIQLSTYAYMLERCGYVVRSLNFQHYNNIGTKDNPEYKFNKNYSFKYLKKEVMSMLNHFKNNKDN